MTQQQMNNVITQQADEINLSAFVVLEHFVDEFLTTETNYFENLEIFLAVIANCYKICYQNEWYEEMGMIDKVTNKHFIDYQKEINEMDDEIAEIWFTTTKEYYENKRNNKWIK